MKRSEVRTQGPVVGPIRRSLRPRQGTVPLLRIVQMRVNIEPNRIVTPSGGSSETNLQGLEIHKSRRRDPRAIDYDRWLILDARTDAVVAGAEGTPRHGMTLDAVEAYLTGDEWTFTKGALEDVLELQHDVAEEKRRAP